MPAPSIPSRFVGCTPEGLSASDWRQVRDLWAAFEIYSPRTTPLRRIAALGRSLAECIAALAALGLDPRNYEYLPLRDPLAC
ncbi:MAG: hypothetical protein ACLQBJ_10620 [Bryobacteraceae bacterium]